MNKPTDGNQDHRDYLALAVGGMCFLFAIMVLCELAIPNGPFTAFANWVMGQS